MNVMTMLDRISEIKKKILYVISNNKEAVKFLTIFISLSLLFFLIYYLIQNSLNFMLVSTASVTGFMSNIIGLEVYVDGVIISLQTMNLEIIHECTGIFAIMISSSSIIAYPTKLKNKVIGILFVIPLILSLNIIRLLFLIYIGKYHMDLFEVVHSYLWQGTFIIFIILAWFLWIEMVVNR